MIFYITERCYQILLRTFFEYWNPFTNTHLVLTFKNSRSNSKIFFTTARKFIHLILGVGFKKIVVVVVVVVFIKISGSLSFQVNTPDRLSVAQLKCSVVNNWRIVIDQTRQFDFSPFFYPISKP